jgi:transposase
MFVGMDVHKESIEISVAEDCRHGEVRRDGVIAGDLEALAKVVRALRGPDRDLHCVYEAGPCGFGIHRYLTAQGEDCVVVNPSSMPKRSGDRIKTDRRDGDALARLHRADELTAIYIPTADDEALRDLVRAREDAVGLCTQAKHRLKAFLLRQGRRSPGRAGWTRPYRCWLADLSFPLAPQHIALQEYRDTIDETERRVERLTDQLRQLAPTWRWAPVVDALQALRGVSFVTAVGLVAEIGDIRRFQHPRELMAYLGLVPSEHSSGPSIRRGGITKAGNPHARRLLAEAAWAYHRDTAHRPADALSPGVAAQDRVRHCLEGATAADVTVPAVGGARKSQTEGGDRDCPRADGLYEERIGHVLIDTNMGHGAAAPGGARAQRRLSGRAAAPGRPDRDAREGRQTYEFRAMVKHPLLTVFGEDRQVAALKP